VQIRVYGPGCANCNRLEQHVHEALRGLGHAAEVRKITDINAITDAGVMRTPALGIDDQLLFQGRVPAVAELTTILADALAGSASSDA
jgi:small redox-active disulfide protein 2